MPRVFPERKGVLPMDKIKTSENTLQNAVRTLKLLSGTVEALTEEAEENLSSAIERIDESIRPAWERYLDKISAFKKELNAYVEECTSALTERNAKIAAYQTAVYKKRNIGGISV